MATLNVLKKVIFTEKSLNQLKSDNVHTFEVNVFSNKFQIASRLEEIFGVKIDKVRISKKKPFLKNRKFKTKPKKKAFIKLKSGYKIPDFEEFLNVNKQFDFNKQIEEENLKNKINKEVNKEKAIKNIVA